MRYSPKPIDTSRIELSGDLRELTEKIAKNVHEVWAASRIAEGWAYGEKRDDIAKTTPCLVPYEELPESEKEYDRNTAIETIKVIMELGYVVVQNRILRNYSFDVIKGMCEAYQVYSILPDESQMKIPVDFVREMEACSNCALEDCNIQCPLDIGTSKISREGVKRIAYMCSCMDDNFLKNIDNRKADTEE